MQTSLPRSYVSPKMEPSQPHSSRRLKASQSSSLSHTNSAISLPIAIHGSSPAVARASSNSRVNSEEKLHSIDALRRIRAQYDDVDTNWFHGMRDFDAASIMIEQMGTSEVRGVCLDLLRVVHLSKLPCFEEVRGDEPRDLSPSPLPDSVHSGQAPESSLLTQITCTANQLTHSGGVAISAADTSRSDLHSSITHLVDSRRAMYLHPNIDIGLSRTASMASLGNVSLASIASRAAVRSTNYLSKTEDEESGHKKFNQYIILSELGRGTQAKVKLAYDTTTKELRAIRIIKKPSSIAVGPARNKLIANRFKRIEREIAVMKRLRHRNLVRLFEVIDDPNTQKLYLVLQYVKNGKLADPQGMFVKNVEENLLLGYARQLCAGLTYLHKRNIAHRDVKPDNILLGDDNDVYLVDFGVSDFLNDVDSDTESKDTELLEGDVFASPRPAGAGASLRTVSELDSSKPSFAVSSARGIKGLQQQSSFASSSGVPMRSPQPTTGLAVGTPAFFAPEAITVPSIARRRRSIFEPEVASMHSSPALRPSSAVVPDPATLNGFALDVWALGVSLFMMLCGRLPWITIDKATSVEVERYSLNFQHYFQMVQHEDPMFPPHQGLLDDREVTKRLFDFEEREEPLPQPWVDLLKSMMTKDPRRRPTMMDVRKEIKAMAKAVALQRGDQYELDELEETQRRMSGSKKEDGFLMARVPSFEIQEREVEDAITLLVDPSFLDGDANASRS